MSVGPHQYPPRLLPEPEAARYLGISAGTLRKQRVRRVLFGGRKLYDRAELDAWATDLPRENAIDTNDADHGDWG